MTPADLQEALELAKHLKNLGDSKTNYPGKDIGELLARAVLHLHARLEKAEKVCEAHDIGSDPRLACFCPEHRAWHDTREGKEAP